MKKTDFCIGLEFVCGGKKWRTTDVGTRIIAAISIEPHLVVSYANGIESYHMTDEKIWLEGPTYAVEEVVFDEDDMNACAKIDAAE